MYSLQTSQFVYGFKDQLCIYIIFSGSFLCFIQHNKINKNQQNQILGTNYMNGVKFQNKMAIQNNFNQTDRNKKRVHKIQLYKGSIMQSQGFVQIMNKINTQIPFKFHNCKATVDSVVFQIKSSEFQRAFTFQNICKRHFIYQYQKILNNRKSIFQQSLNSLNLTFKDQINVQDIMSFSISRRKSYKGFRSKTTRNSIEDLQNLVIVDIYDAMIKNKQKVLSLQKQYKSKSEKKLLQKSSLRYQDNKKLKQNYKKMKIKDFQIQRLALRNSITNVINHEGFQNIKSRLNQVKGMFEDEIDQIQKVIKQQRKAMLQVQINKQNKRFKRKAIRLKSYSPQVIKQFQLDTQDVSKTTKNSRRISMAQNIPHFRQIKQQNISKENISKENISKENVSKTDLLIKSKMSIKNIDKYKKQVQEKKSCKENQKFEIFINGCKQSSKQIFYSPLKCINNMTRRDNRRAKTFKAKSRRSSQISKESIKNLIF